MVIAANRQDPRSVALLDDHAGLRDLLEQARQTVARREAPRHEIVDLIDDLAEAVLEHFQQEEAGGYFAKAVEAAPQFRQRAEQLCREHAAMVEQIKGLQEHAACVGESADWWQTLEHALSRFLACFRSHEAAENTLLQEAYCHDLGAED